MSSDSDSSNLVEGDFLEAFVEWIEFCRPMLAGIDTYSWNGGDQTASWDLLRRGIVTRQFEAMEAIKTMVEKGCGHFAVVLLRPAYEELMWIRYLYNNAEVAPRLIPLLMSHETATTLTAQNEFAGKKDMASLGFPKGLVQSRLKGDKKTKEEIRKIGEQLGWDMKRQLLPSMAWLSRKVDQEREHKFLYQGTSRFVHFSIVEIFRRAWIHKGKVTISSETMSGHWQTFAMFWSTHIFLDLLIACSDLIPKDSAEGMNKKLDDIVKRAAPFAKVPIITIRELMPV